MMALITTRILIAGGLMSCLYAFSSASGTTPSFLVSFPALIWSDSEAKLCASLLSPNETLLMSIYLTHGNQKKMLHQETADKDFHRCFHFQAPSVQQDSLQKIIVEVKGQTCHWIKESRVKFRPKPAPIIFIQTDKPIYIPGQTVQFRLVTMDTNFIPLREEYKLILLEDTRGNTIGQWLNVTSQSKLVQLSHVLNPEAPQGKYTLRVEGKQTSTQSHEFEVKKYVLPKFDVTLTTPKNISVGAEAVQVEACAKYTFGHPVRGKADLLLCRDVSPYYYEGDAEICCANASVLMDDSGCASHSFGMAMFTGPELNKKLKDSFIFNATVTEEGTGITRANSKDFDLSYYLGELAFFDTPDKIEDGAVLNGKIKATHYNGTALAYTMVYLFKPDWKSVLWNPELLLNLTTDSDGVAQFSLDTAPFPGDFELTASTDDIKVPVLSITPRYGSTVKSVSRIRPASLDIPSSSSLAIKDVDEPLQCDKDVAITAKYIFTGETFHTDHVDIIYMVLSKGEIVHHGFSEAPVQGSQPVSEGEVSFQLPIRAEMAPSVKVLLYCVLPSETVLAKSRTFSTEKCFKNKVALQFSPSKSVPGEQSSLQISAQPGSLCGLSAVDQSIFILKPEKRLDTQKIYGLLPSMDSQVDDEVDDHGSWWCIADDGSSSDGILETFLRLGVKVVTSRDLPHPECPYYYEGVEFFREASHSPSSRATGTFRKTMSPLRRKNLQRKSVPPVQTVRTFFPETWIWHLTEVGESGEVQVPLTVPDTITTWETEAFCLSPQGFGLAPPVQLTVFQPFFLELSLPYSIIRGETFELKATVFNYLPNCIMVTVTPASSSDFTLTPSSDGQYSSCLCANGRKTFRWTLVPSVLGEMSVAVSAAAESSQTVCGNEVVTVPERGCVDTVTRSLKVQAEGTEKTKSFSWLLCPKGGALTEEVELNLPQDVVKGSARASVSVLGDILGCALKNIGNLLKMPYGCGEQNMAILSPNIYILQYLQNTGQLTADITKKVTNFLESGYQRQLNYKHHDGSYSTFGSGDGNTWLTAFVLRSLGKAKSFVYIDQQILMDAKTWLESKLRPDGVFHMQGKLFHNRMKGGVSDDVTITAYITASLLELEMPVAEQTWTFLKSSSSDVSNTYTTALLAYTFSLAGEEDIRSELLKHLDSVATSSGNLLHWSQSSSERADSLAVEISSYVLLAVLTKSTLTAADLGYAARIVSWLVKQQNPYGGFSSTQDTVVALQALALYATKIFSPQSSSTVTVQSAGGAKHQFELNQHNTLLYQERALQDVPGKYSIEVKGSVCASVGVGLFYNIPTPTEHSTLSIKTEATSLTEGECNKAIGQAFTLKITVQYIGPLQSTNMAIIDLTMLSGFTPDTDSVERFKGRSFTDRVDKKDDHILIYLTELPKDRPLHYELIIRQDLTVNNLKPAVVKIYDYYQTSDQAETEYSSPCAGGA